MNFGRQRSVAFKKEQRGHAFTIPFTIDGICIATIWHEQAPTCSGRDFDMGIHCNDYEKGSSASASIAVGDEYKSFNTNGSMLCTSGALVRISKVIEYLHCGFPSIRSR